MGQRRGSRGPVGGGFVLGGRLPQRGLRPAGARVDAARCAGGVLRRRLAARGRRGVESLRRVVPEAPSDAGSLPEAAGDAVVYFDPLDEGAIAAAIISLLED